MTFGTLAPRPGHRRIAVRHSSIATTVNFMFAKPTSNKIHGIVSNLKYVQLLMYFRSYMGRFSLVQIPPVHHKFITISLVPKKKPRPQSSGSIRAMIKKRWRNRAIQSRQRSSFLGKPPMLQCTHYSDHVSREGVAPPVVEAQRHEYFHGRGIP